MIGGSNTGKHAQQPDHVTRPKATIVPAITIAGRAAQLKQCTAFGRAPGGLRVAWAIPAPDGL